MCIESVVIGLMSSLRLREYISYNKTGPAVYLRNICVDNPYQVTIIIIRRELGFDRRVPASPDTGNV
jgi:hypothetical protein